MPEERQWQSALPLVSAGIYSGCWYCCSLRVRTILGELVGKSDSLQDAIKLSNRFTEDREGLDGISTHTCPLCALSGEYKHKLGDWPWT